jgi:hypothetical protein
MSLMASLPIAVLMQRRALDHPWASEAWHAIGVLPDAGDLQPMQMLSSGEGRDTYLVSGLRLDLYPDEHDGYFENCMAPEPKVFVMWRMIDGRAMAGARLGQLCGRHAHLRLRRAGRRRRDAGRGAGLAARLPAAALPAARAARTRPWLSATVPARASCGAGRA